MTASVKVDYMCHLDRESLDKAQHLFGEDEATRRQLVQELREWIKEQPYLHSKTGLCSSIHSHCPASRDSLILDCAK